MRNPPQIRQGQVWQAKDQKCTIDRTIIVHEVNGNVVWVELQDGQKITITHTQLLQNYRLING